MSTRRATWTIVLSLAVQAKHKYALIDLQFEATDVNIPHPLYHVFRSDDNRAELVRRVNLPELSCETSFDGPSVSLGQGWDPLPHQCAHLELPYTTNGSAPAAAKNLRTVIIFGVGLSPDKTDLRESCSPWPYRVAVVVRPFQA